MRLSFFRPTFALLSRLRSLFEGGEKPRTKERLRHRARPRLESLEDRLAPATLTDQFGTLTIILDTPNENLSITAIGTNQYGLTSSTDSLFSAGLAGAAYGGNTNSGP